MTGRIVINYFGRESLFGSDDLIVAAVERVVRERLTQGRTMFLSATAIPESGREHITQMLTPQTWVLFTYDDLGGADPNQNPKLLATIEMLRQHVEKYGGICLDEDDLPVEPV